MQPSQTPRFNLPLLAIGQSQKELFHNEALAHLDFLLHPIVQSTKNDPAQLSLEEGLSWLVDSASVGDWAGRTNQIASWTSGGWRFTGPVDYMLLFIVDVQETAIFRNDSWQMGGSLVGPAGGTTVDVEARQSIDSILEILKMKGIVAE